LSAPPLSAILWRGRQGADAILQAESTFLLSERTPPARERQIATAVGAALLIAFLGLLPFRDRQLPVSVAFIPIIDSTLFVNDLITAALLYAQYVVGGRRGMLTLAVGYLFSAFIIVPHLLMFPGAFTATGLLGANFQSSAWLYVFRYLGFPTAVIVYTLQKDGSVEPGDAANARGRLGASILVVAALVWALTWLAIHNQRLPQLMVDATHGGWVWKSVVRPGLLLAYVVAIAALWRRRSSTLDLWLLLALWAWLIEVVLLSLATSRFSVFWYACVFGVVASCLVLIVLLYESTILYARFAQVAAERDRERERQRLTLQVVAGSIAHELQQPLTAIVTNAEAGRRLVTQTPPVLDEVAAALHDIAAEGQRAGDTISAIRATLAGAPQPLALVSMSDLVRETLSFMRGELRRHEVSVQLQVSADLSPVKGNKGQLLQVLVNLVTNAIEAMLGVMDRPRVLGLNCAMSAPASVSVSVEDCGAGIPPEHIVRIFDPFFTTKTHGTGLGLALCRAIVEAHGGMISASRGREHGSVFRVVLPASPAERLATDPAAR
jgi:signal transduction histidine kinase